MSVLHAFQLVLILLSFCSSVTAAVVVIANAVVAKYARLSDRITLIIAHSLTTTKWRA